ncbi:hypothetical protein QLX08_007973 [Tetragonisca angustula]|uniref:Uncharacterized protein n=1 Tax=Tetragonisca angustula TaxID=166442 RepID=A0AAW0ZNU2_9HYME
MRYGIHRIPEEPPLPSAERVLEKAAETAAAPFFPPRKTLGKKGVRTTRTVGTSPGRLSWLRFLILHRALRISETECRVPWHVILRRWIPHEAGNVDRRFKRSH